MTKLRWGILSTAKIGLRKVIPAMQQGQYCTVDAIASRDLGRAIHAAQQLGIARAYGSYEELLADDAIDAIYNPLPNHLHVPWSLKALAAGKHVLCEKPVGMSAAEAQQLHDASRQSHSLVMEAFMYRWHPQWQRARSLVREGAIGQLATIQTFFSYYNDNPADYRNQKECGGGGLMDIGCYAISLSRWLFEAEPQRALGRIDYNSRFGTDRLASAVLDFDNGTASFTCGTLLTPYQRVQIVGDRGLIEIEIPFNAPPDRPCRIWLDGITKVEIVFPVCDQYTLQGDGFSRCALNGEAPPTSIEDAVANMRVIEAVVRSDRTGAWELP